MEEQFAYGEKVMVRNDDNQDWQLRHYIDTVELGDTGEKIYCVHFKNEDQNHHSGLGTCFRQIWKIQNPLRQPEQGTIEYLQGQIHTLNKRLMALENELHIKSMNKPVKNQDK